jgi:hypothetical protein
MSGPRASSPADAVRTAVAAAASRRHRRNVMRRLWLSAPFAATTCLLVVLAARWAGTPRAVPLLAIGLFVVGSAVYVYLRERERASADAVAASIDEDGGFGGELRSAIWFAARGSHDEWALCHLDRAATRLAATEWQNLYPTVGAWSARGVTAGLLVAALALVGTWPHAATLRASVPVAAGDAAALSGQDERPLVMIPADLRKRIEELIAAAERGTLSTDDQKAKALELYNLFTQVNSDVDPEKLAELAKAMDPEHGGTAGQAAKKLWDLAGHIQTAADARGTPEDLRKALESLGLQVTASAAAEDRKASEDGQQTASAGAGNNAQPSDQAASNGPASLDPDSIQISKDATAGASAGMTMLSDMPGQRGQAGGGFGGGGRSGPAPAAGTMPGLADALRHETIEASTDTAGQNVLSETRRQTERGRATASFTDAAPGASDRSLAGVPPPVPEDRRATVQSYFTRPQ